MSTKKSKTAPNTTHSPDVPMSQSQDIGTSTSAQNNVAQGEKSSTSRKEPVSTNPGSNTPTPAGQDAAPQATTEIDAKTEAAVTPGVEHEDITAEVEARLKAKKEKDRAKRQSKKRKRMSTESNISAKEPSIAKVRVEPETQKRKRVKVDVRDGPGKESSAPNKRPPKKRTNSGASTRSAKKAKTSRD